MIQCYIESTKYLPILHLYNGLTIECKASSPHEKRCNIPHFWTLSYTFSCGPRHIPTPSPLKNYCVREITNKKLNFFTKGLKVSFNSLQKFWRHITCIHLKYAYCRKKCTFGAFFKIVKIYLRLNRLVSIKLTKISQIDPKLNFNVFHILNHDYISKIEKIFDGTTPPQK